MKAPRDMTAEQFAKALRDNGFRKVLFWIEDTSGQCPDISWGIVFSRRTGKIMCRATIAKVLRDREKELAKRAISPMNATPANNLVGPS